MKIETSHIKITLNASAKVTFQTELTMTFSERFRDFSQDTSMHGVKYVGKENAHWVKRQVIAFTRFYSKYFIHALKHVFTQTSASAFSKVISKTTFYCLCQNSKYKVLSL